MRHVFIINPAAGKQDRTEQIRAEVAAAFQTRPETPEIRVSRAPGDGIRLAREACEEGGELRLYACGGDGTLNEVVNGAVGYPDAAVTHYPAGSGNDFIKTFHQPEAFRALERLLDPEEKELDLIRCGDRFSLNICSMGFDARIGTSISRYKRLPLVTGSGAYIISTIVNTIQGIHRPYEVEIDGVLYKGEQSLICIGNGRYYGGSFNPLPKARMDDGELDVLLVRDVSRLTVLRVIGAYGAGRYEEYPELIRHFRCRQVRIRCEKEEPINLDGELLMSRDATFCIADEKIRFFYPRGLNCDPDTT